MRSRREGRLVVIALVTPVVLGVAVGLLWWALAPTATVIRLRDATLVSASSPEFAATQVGLLALLGAGAGAATGALAVVAVAWGRRPVRLSLAVLLTSAAGSGIAAGIGHLLGPAAVAAQLAAHPKAALTSPLSIHTPVVLLVWPAIAAVVMALGYLAVARSTSRRLSPLGSIMDETGF